MKDSFYVSQISLYSNKQVNRKMCAIHIDLKKITIRSDHQRIPHNNSVRSMFHKKIEHTNQLTSSQTLSTRNISLDNSSTELLPTTSHHFGRICSHIFFLFFFLFLCGENSNNINTKFYMEFGTLKLRLCGVLGSSIKE